MDWTAVTLARHSPVPLYYQLAELIRERIRAGALAPGDQLPAERDLADRTGISRMTARQAVGYLVRDGALVVRPGIGTFVAEPKLSYDALHLLGFTEATARRGGHVSSRVLEQVVAPPPAAVAAELRLPDGAAAVKIVRLRSAADAPLLLETSYVPHALCPGLEREDLGKRSLYGLLELRYGLRLGRAHQMIEATVADEFESRSLRVDLGAPLLLLQGVTYTEDEQPVEWFNAVYRADRVRFELESRREARGRELVRSPRASLVLT